MAVSEHSSRKWRWLALAVAVLLLALASYFASQYRPAKPAAAVPVETPAPSVVRNQTPADFIGSASYAGCHSEQHPAWQESQHAPAIAHASADTVMADFNDSRFEYAGTVSRFQQRDGRYFVTTDGADGQLTEYEVLYTFGLDPLQPVPGRSGRWPPAGPVYRLGYPAARSGRPALVPSVSGRAGAA